jgi:ubiquinone/menaquinone biosynthesis C-methylase UbiE
MGFGHLARCYEALERATFGGVLQRARTYHLEQLAPVPEVLLLGDGDGRFLEALLVERARRGTTGSVVSVDASRGMLERARERIAGLPGADQVQFVHSPAGAFEPPADYSPGAIASQFFLDCFDEEALAELANQISVVASPGAVWVIADFSLPPRRSPWRLPARALIWVMYRFFALAAGLRAKRLPNFHKALNSSGWRLERCACWMKGLVFSSVWRQPGS